MGFLRFFDETVEFFISDIRKQTGKGFFETFFDTGNYGEFLSYKYLVNTPGKRDYIHNCYVPVDRGYTEIDFILVHETGIYVVESKNYSGWIFGDEQAKNWTQVMAGGRTRIKFYNPIRQNAGHIKALKAFLKDYPDLRFYSLIVFSERCELKKVSCTLPDTFVIKRNDLKPLFKRQIKNRDKFPEAMLAEVASRLKPYCRLDAEDKAAHIERIKAMQVGKPFVLVEPIAPAKVAGASAGSGTAVADEAVMMETASETTEAVLEEGIALEVSDASDDDEDLVIDEAMAAEIAAFESAMESAGESLDDPEDDADDESVDDTDDNPAEATDEIAAEALPVENEEVSKGPDESMAPSSTVPGAPHINGSPVQSASMTCPRCQRPLIERNGKNGRFIGCTGFPSCRYTRNL